MEIEKAFKRLLIKNPFYGLFCLSLPKRVTDEVSTLAVMKKGINCELCINREFWDKFTDDEQIALLQHELSHICLQHMFLSDYFSDHKAFNISADMEVNSYIENLPKGGCKASDLGLKDGLGTKQYYEALTNKQQNQAQQPQAGNGDSGQEEQEKEQEYPDYTPQNKEPLDTHKTWKQFQNMPEATKQLMQNNINTIVKNTAEQIEKQRGTIPGELRELVDKLREKKPEVFNWKAYFRRLLGSIYDVNIKSTRRKVSKRFEGAAGIQHKKKVSILVAVDTSGSVSTKELQEFFSEIDYIYKAGARITLIQCDTRINGVEEYNGKNIPEIKGRGGTNFNPPVDYYIKHKKDYASLIYFTDGECELPERSPSGMVWVITSNGCCQDYPGKVIYIPPEHK